MESAMLFWTPALLEKKLGMVWLDLLSLIQDAFTASMRTFLETDLMFSWRAAHL